MTISNPQALKLQRAHGSVHVGALEAALEGTAVSLPVLYDGPNTQWTYSATAEGLTGEVAVNSVDMDGQPGLIYSGPVGAHVRVDFSNIDIAGLASSVPEATDEFNLAVYRNNDLVGVSDEGWSSEFDTATVEFNGSCVIPNMQTNDVVRFGLLTGEGDEDALVVDVTEGGEIVIG